MKKKNILFSSGGFFCLKIRRSKADSRFAVREKTQEHSENALYGRNCPPTVKRR
jgi:hypothetical protein